MDDPNQVSNELNKWFKQKPEDLVKKTYKPDTVDPFSRLRAKMQNRQLKFKFQEDGTVRITYNGPHPLFPILNNEQAKILSHACQIAHQSRSRTLKQNAISTKPTSRVRLKRIAVRDEFHPEGNKPEHRPIIHHAYWQMCQGQQ